LLQKKDFVRFALFFVIVVLFSTNQRKDCIAFLVFYEEVIKQHSSHSQEEMAVLAFVREKQRKSGNAREYFLYVRKLKKMLGENFHSLIASYLICHTILFFIKNDLYFILKKIFLLI